MLTEKRNCKPKKSLQKISLKGLFIFSAKYVYNDLRNKSYFFKTGLFCIFIVVAFVAIVMGIQKLVPFVFLKFSQELSGAADIIAITQKPSFGINHTEFSKNCKKIKEISGCSPRWVFKSNINNLNGSEPNKAVQALVIQSQNEKNIGLAKHFAAPNLKPGEAYLTKELALQMKLKTGAKFYITFLSSIVENFFKKQISYPFEKVSPTNFHSKNNFFNVFFGKRESEEEFPFDDFDPENPFGNLTNWTSNDQKQFDVPFTVKHIVDNADGKWPAIYADLVVLEANGFLDHIFNSFLKTLPKYEREMYKEMYPSDSDKYFQEIAFFEVIVLKNRISLYSDTSSLSSKIIPITNKLRENDASQYIIPLSKSAIKTSRISNMLDTITRFSLIVLLIASFLIFYTLMIGKLDEKTYELGILRVFGFKKYTTLVIVVLNTIIFCIPGIVLGLVFSYMNNILLSFIFYGSINEARTYKPDENTMKMGIFIGIVIPLLSNIKPTLRILSNSIKDCLQYCQTSFIRLEVKLKKLEKKGISGNLIFISVLLISIGLTTYFIIPYTFLMREMRIFLFIMDGILLLLLFTATYMMHLAQPFLEIKFAEIFSRFPIFYVIFHNFKTQRIYLNKISIFICMLCSFLVFCSICFSVQNYLATNFCRKTNGSDYVVEIEGKNNVFDEFIFEDFIQKFNESNPNIITSFSFMSKRFEDVYHLQDSIIAPLSFKPKKEIQIRAVDRNFLKSTYNDLLYYTETDEIKYPLIKENNKKDLVSGLYIKNGTIKNSDDVDPFMISSNNYDETTSIKLSKFNVKALVPHFYQKFLSLTTKELNSLIVNGHKFPLKIRAFITSFPNVQSSSYSLTERLILISFDDLYEIQKKIDPQFEKIHSMGLNSSNFPKEKLFIRVNDSTNSSKREELSSELKLLLKDKSYKLYDMLHFISIIQSGFSLIHYFYIGVSFICLILSFIYSFTSFKSMIQQFKNEIKVFKSIGLSEKSIRKIYIIQVAIITVFSCVLGLLTGLGIGYLSSVQLFAFIEIPLPFIFPWEIFLIFTVGSLFLSLLAIYSALNMK